VSFRQLLRNRRERLWYAAVSPTVPVIPRSRDASPPFTDATRAGLRYEVRVPGVPNAFSTYLAVGLLTACAPSPEARTARQEPLSADATRAAWAPLANDEIGLQEALAALALETPGQKVTKLEPIRADTGLLIAGLARIQAAPELVACQGRAVEGAKHLRAALDAVHELWMGRLPRAASPVAQARALAAEICEGFDAIRRARTECGVPPPRALRGPRVCDDD
jgi:hypothetical protein